MQLPKAISSVSLARKRAIEWQQLRGRVFKYESSPADERYFKIKIQEFLKGINPEQHGWHRFLTQIIWERNSSGATSKYMYFHDFSQRLYVDRDFEKWAQTTREQIHKLLKQINA